MRNCSRSSSACSLEADRDPSFLRVWLLAVLAVACAACAPLVTKPVADQAARTQAWNQHSAAIAKLSSWSFTGRIVVRNGGEGFSGTLRWRQDGERFLLRIIAPLAQGSWQLAGDPRGVEMSAPKGERRSAADAETLLREVLGWSVPVAGARYWVSGIPDPSSDVRKLDLDEQGRLAVLEQAGWNISELEYVPVGSYELPKRLSLRRDELLVKLAVSRWELPE